MSDDITFCGSDCKNYECFRHPSNIREPRIPHSFAYLKDTEDCPMKKQEVRLIDANALKEAFYHRTNRSEFEIKYMCTTSETIISLIDNAPTVEYPFYAEAYQTGYEEGKNERPKGEWIKSANMSKKSYQRLCSNCRNIVYFCGNGNYPNCPYCLADMRGTEE